MVNLCKAFRAEAGTVFKRLTQSETTGISFSEETVTELASADLAMQIHPYSVITRLATKAQESGHGGDWEWIFRKGRRCVRVRVQAKKLKRARFDGLAHVNRKTGLRQMDVLINRAKIDNVVPLYCFYSAARTDFKAQKNLCHHRYLGRSYWGCGLARAEHIKRLGKDDLRSILPLTRPWHELVCGDARIDLPTRVQAVLGGQRESSALADPSALLFHRTLAPGNPDDVVPSIEDVPAYVEEMVEAYAEWQRATPLEREPWTGDGSLFKLSQSTDRGLDGILVISDPAA